MSGLNFNGWYIEFCFCSIFHAADKRVELRGECVNRSHTHISSNIFGKNFKFDRENQSCVTNCWDISHFCQFDLCARARACVCDAVWVTLTSAASQCCHHFTITGICVQHFSVWLPSVLGADDDLRFDFSAVTRQQLLFYHYFSTWFFSVGC